MPYIDELSGWYSNTDDLAQVYGTLDDKAECVAFDVA